MPRSIRWRLALAFGFPTVVFLLLLGYYLASVFERFHLARMQLDLSSQAIHMAGEFAPDILARKSAQDIQSRLDALRTPNSNVLRALVLDSNGALLASSWEGDNDKRNAGQRIEELGVREALAGAEASGATSSSDAAREALYATVPIKRDGRVVGVLRLSYDLGHLEEVKRQLRLAVGAGTAVAAFLLLGLSLWIADTVARPLRILGQAARHVAQGHFEVRAPMRPRDEVGQLADAFNHMSARLQEAEQARRQFLADVVHELRAPVAGVKAATEALAAGAADAPDLRPQFIQGISREADRLNRLVEDLTQLARFETGTMDLNIVQTDVAALARQVHQRFAPEAERRRVQLDAVSSPDSLLVQGDPDRLAQAMSDLVDNALKFTPSGGAVRIEAGQRPDAVWVKVTDTGVGIPAEELPHVFDRSYRGRHSSTAARSGMGLGLAIARGIVEAHGGSIAAESQVGRGSVFTIRLPSPAPGRSASRGLLLLA
ncbi:MAG: sensor histidine kinase [Chloroflexi bacterium]|nr:sensor histidine kinase [Chloroflexota bacterium]